MISCRECKEPINIGATRCHHCSAHQSWFRFLGNGAMTAGALVLTLVSIWAAQPIKDFFDPQKADINVSILEGNVLYTIFMVSNTGSRPAGLVQIEIQSKLKGGSGTWYLSSELDKKLIEPGKAYVLKASNGSVIPEPVSHETLAMLSGKVAIKEYCDLVLQYVEMNGTKVYKHFPFACHVPEMNNVSPLSKNIGNLAHPSTEPPMKRETGR